jgi:hypothetical protein
MKSNFRCLILWIILLCFRVKIILWSLYAWIPHKYHYLNASYDNLLFICFIINLVKWSTILPSVLLPLVIFSVFGYLLFVKCRRDQRSQYTIYVKKIYKKKIQKLLYIVLYNFNYRLYSMNKRIISITITNFSVRVKPDLYVHDHLPFYRTMRLPRQPTNNFDRLLFKSTRIQRHCHMEGLPDICRPTHSVCAADREKCHVIDI